jgi:hypothetical protein
MFPKYQLLVTTDEAFDESGRISIYTPLDLDFSMTTLTLTHLPAPAFRFYVLPRQNSLFPMLPLREKITLLQRYNIAKPLLHSYLKKKKKNLEKAVKQHQPLFHVLPDFSLSLSLLIFHFTLINKKISIFYT